MYKNSLEGTICPNTERSPCLIRDMSMDGGSAKRPFVVAQASRLQLPYCDAGILPATTSTPLL